VLPAILNDAGGVLAYGRKRRLAAAGLRKAVIARDRGCTFPGCSRTAAQSEIHHAIAWANGGSTDLNNLAVACGYHNTEAPKMGWQTIMLDGIPHGNHPTGTRISNHCATTCTTPNYSHPRASSASGPAPQER
jgi:hypothetical protein